MSKPDTNYRSYADVSNILLCDDRIVPPTKLYDDTLKLSHVDRFLGVRLYVVGGRENAVDMNRQCQSVVFDDCTFESGDHCAVVIKGGSSDISLKQCLIYSHHSSYDIELGGWSDQCMDRTRRVSLEYVRRSDGEPVRIVVGWADAPHCLGEKCRILFWRSLGLKLFCLGRFLAKKIFGQ